jgi:ABC-type branched-subunit amino acid transport system substrate-binding protein
MRSTIRITAVLAATALLVWAPACGKRSDRDKEGTGETGQQAEQPAAKKVPGVDMDKKVLRIGVLNDESGPAAALGKPFALGKRLLARVVNEDGGILPDGWTIQLVERDHAYNPQQSVQHYSAIKDDVLFVGHSFGTPNTLPLRGDLERDGMVAFPASLSSEMAAHEHTPPLGPSYKIEAMRAMDFAVEHAGGADKVKAGIVYQHDDYGKDGLDGWKKAAAHHGVKIVAEQTITPGQQDVTAVVTSLRKQGANYVLLAILPSTTGPIVGTAAQLKYMPVWLGNTPAWMDVFFNPEVIPSQVFGNFHWVTGFSYWGEDVPGMDAVLAAWEKHGKDMGQPDFYILASYVQGLIQLEAFRRALEAGDVSRAGYKKALRSIDGWDAGGIMQPVSLTAFPYVTGTRTRVLKPDFENRSWTQVADFAEPAARGAD